MPRPHPPSVCRVGEGIGFTARAAGQRPKEGLLFGLVIPNLGETEIFEPICQGIAAAPEARGHGLLWAHADQGVESREEQALELAIWRRSTCCSWARGGWASCAWKARRPP